MPDQPLPDLLICADDFGMRRGISDAIVELSRLERIDAVSAMVEFPGHDKDAARLGPFLPRLQIGLHFNLTEGIAAEPFSLPKLICSPRLSDALQREVSRRLETQLDLFEQYYAMKPDFVDGHQHVHMLPGLRHVFLAQIARRYPDSSPRPWIRVPVPYLTRTDAHLKALLLKTLGIGFRSACSARGLRTNRHFDGVYSLRSSARYAPMLEAWIKRAAPGTVIMCHPAVDAGSGDPDKARINEFAALSAAPRKDSRRHLPDSVEAG